MRRLAIILCAFVLMSGSAMAGLERLKHNNPGLVVDLGVGLWAWPMPMDFDGDGDFDLVGNVLPKLGLLQQFGFYLKPELAANANAESCGAHSPRLEPATQS